MKWRLRRYYPFFIRAARGLRGKLRMLLALIAAEHGPDGRLAKLGLSRLVAPLGDLSVHCDLAHGELHPYWQILDDQRIGLLPEEPGAEGWTVIDGGANIGLFALAMRRAARVVAVEPNPEACERLRWNVGENGVRAEIVACALSDRTGTLRINFDREPSVLARPGSTGVAVRATTVDNLLAERGIPRVDLLKLDLEGHELEALHGAERALRSGLIDRIYVEANTDADLVRLDRMLTPHFERRGRGRFNTLYVRAML